MILKPGSNCMDIYQACTTGLIVDACDYYRTFYHAAAKARRSILLAGWQFDSEVPLLRGREAEQCGEVRFLHFLESLCERLPDLEIYILAWDFSVIFSMEREWFQDIIFNWTTNERIHFRFDGKHAIGATHHQKFVVVDGAIAFVGGMDICSERWDDRHHLLENASRVDANGPYGPYHDIQSFHTGPIVGEFTRLFEQRWLDSGGAPLLLPPPLPGHTLLTGDDLIPLATDRVAVSRTQASDPQTRQSAIQEIRRLFIDAISMAEQLIYLENQYFSSQAVYRALIDRMTDPGRSSLQIIMIVPDKLPFTEELFLGVPQMKMLRSLQRTAEETGHELRVYSTACIKNGERTMTFIHSKLLLVDDRFLTIGSANITNRSLGLDTELNVSWEAEPGTCGGLIESIRRVRTSLLAEHAGQQGREADFQQIHGLIRRLDRLVEEPDSRLCWYEPDPELENNTWPGALEPIARVVDPEENVYEQITRYRTSAFARGIRLVSQWITGL
ncbi:phospholipase D-like domain-containing protein [Geobacter sp. SVR]|uniref:phospholipase D-like domain-containing protein n=1 Tax=Geobacter sp. SVR TaxID=2495594 RepID=UPI00143F023F|nr:phospholipase D-like domain-containing protein [Geobacter sp. SVR]BCS54461.1 hypothetical protein GSVR_27690 [Geobacter sp. SVR]GCF87060.1 phospholipase D/transphosphatidylase [Geobacter sp. SVR]